MGNTPLEKGLEAWRRLVHRFDPTPAQANHSLVGNNMKIQKGGPFGAGSGKEKNKGKGRKGVYGVEEGGGVSQQIASKCVSLRTRPGC